MKLTAKTDFDVPLQFAYAVLSDHRSWERDAAERGLRIERPADMPLSGPGAGWLLHLPYRGKLVKILLRLVQEIPDEKLAFDLLSPSIEGEFDLAVMALSPRRTRLHLVIEVRPRSMAARLLLNALRLAKGRVQSRLDQRVAQVGAQIQKRYAQSQQ